MCGTCGCAVTGAPRQPEHARLGTLDSSAARRETIDVLTHLLQENDDAAAHNREHFERHGVTVVNLMSAPGAGKTALLEATIQALQGRLRLAVIEGDLETENDAQRIRAHGVPAVQIVTGTACHLDAHMIHRALHALELDGVDLLFIENVGNLVCPASFDLGQHAKVTLLSVTEGDDKPAKYPVMFRAADLVLYTKSDLLPVLDDFDPDRATTHLRALASTAPVYTLSARSPATLQPWLAWLDGLRTARAAGAHLRPRIQPQGAHVHA